MPFIDPLLQQLARQGGDYSGSRELGGAGGQLPDFRDNSVQSYNQRLQMQANAQRFTGQQDAQQLQQAYAMRQARSTPTDGGSVRASAPMVSSIRASKALSRSTMLNGVPLSDDDKSNLDTLTNDDSMNPQQYEGMLQKIAAAHQMQQTQQDQTQRTQQDAQSKFAFAKGLVNDPDFKDEGLRNQVRAMVQDPRTSLNEIRGFVEQVKGKSQQASGNSQKQVNAIEDRQVTNDATEARPGIAAARKNLITSTEDAKGTPTDKTKAVSQLLDSAPQDEPRAMRASGIDYDTAQRFLSYRNLQAQPAEEQAEVATRQLSEATGDPAFQKYGQQQQQSSGPVQVKTPEDAMALPPGTRFIGPDGQIRVRH